VAAGRKTGGRQKGTPNKINALLKDQILQAASEAHPEGIVGYLRDQANENPGPFMTLLGKILPTQVEGTGEAGAIVFKTVYANE
jgi:stalled ribosome alternative rescue factor ArfA